MSAEPTTDSPANAFAGLPEGYIAVPLSAGQAGAPLRLCVLVRPQPEPVAGHLVTLREAVDARVLLGCVIDAGLRVHQWVEIWIQTLEGINNTLTSWREALSNDALDTRWQRQFLSLCAPDLKGIIRTGWERRHPLPMWLDLEKRLPVHPSDGNDPWRLCTDDATLAAAGLPPYSTSLHRYLYLHKLGPKSTFIPVTADAPAGNNTRPLEAVLGGRSGLVPVNPGGGLMLVRGYSPVSLESFLDLLAGAPVEEITTHHGRHPLHIDTPLQPSMHAAADAEVGGSDGWLFLGHHGKWGRLLESFHLRLRALAEAIDDVRCMVERTQRPLLNLAADRFQVRTPERGRALPLLWTARTTLVDPGDAVELPIEATDVRYYLPGRPSGASIYRPEKLGHFAEGRCSVRLRKVLGDLGGATVAEGTFATQERIRPEKNDLVRLRVPLGGGRLDLYARMESEAALAAGEWRFRTVGQRLDEAAAEQLRSAEGVPLSNVTFELMPLLSTPVDLYSLAVLAVRSLLVNPQTSLPEALDEMLSLARQVAHEHEPESELKLRVGSLFEKDERWLASLGPHRLSWEPVAPAQAMDLVPPELWWDVMAMIIRMFPGIGPDSTASGYGDASPGGLHKMFDRARADLDALLVRTRSLIVIDWHYNREIHAVIRGFATGLSGASAPAPAPPRRPVSNRRGG